jgi:hypothetical protein
MYLDNVHLRDTVDGYPADSSSSVSTAFYYQRLRVGTDFIVSPGLKLVTRFDALERVWGGARTAPGVGTNAYGQTSCVGNATASGCDGSSVATRAESENIAFEVAYVEYISPIGLFRAGYMPGGAWGSVLGDSAINGAPAPKLVYGIALGQFSGGFTMEKAMDNSFYYNNAAIASDRDYDKYSLAGKYDFNKNIEAGIAFAFWRHAQTRGESGEPLYSLDVRGAAPGFEFPALQAWLGKVYAVNPYAKAKFGPVALEAEVAYMYARGEFENDTKKGDERWQDVTAKGWSVFLDGALDFGKVYGGLQFAWVSGDDPHTTDQIEGGLLKSGKDYNPCLILLNFDRSYWASSMTGYDGDPAARTRYITGSGTSLNTDGVNFFLYQGRIGVRPVDKLDIMATLTYAKADERPENVIDKEYGWEADITGTYKITNNLSYMLGAGYLWTGDYFQGTSRHNYTTDNYLITNKLTLTF